MTGLNKCGAVYDVKNVWLELGQPAIPVLLEKGDVEEEAVLGAMVEEGDAVKVVDDEDAEEDYINDAGMKELYRCFVSNGSLKDGIEFRTRATTILT